MSRSKKLTLILFLIFLFSRVIFIRTEAVFFDGPEYVRRLSADSLTESFKLGHAPFHSPYFLINWPIYHSAEFLNINPIVGIKLIASLLGFFSLYFFYKTACGWFGKKTAFLTSLLAGLTPLFWTTNISILIESVYPVFFWLSLYFWQKYLIKSNFGYIFISGLFLGLTYLTQSPALFFLPFYFLMPKRARPTKKQIYRAVFIFIISLLLSRFIDQKITIFTQQTGWQSKLYLGNLKFYLRTFFSFDLSIYLRVIRNFVFINSFTITPLIVLPAILGFRQQTKIQRLKFWPFWLLMISLLISSQSMDVNIGGRHTLLGIFAWVLLAGFYLQKKTKLKIFIISGLFIYSTIRMTGFLKPIPYLIQAEKITSLPENQMVIIEHYARPFVDYNGQLVLVNEPGFSLNELGNQINKSLADKKQVFITSGALNDPHHFYNGPWRHPVSSGYKPSTLVDFNKKYNLEIYQPVLPKKNIYIYQLKN